MRTSTLLTDLGPKLLIPVLFLGYAAAVNVGFVQNVGNDTDKLPNSVSAIFDGAGAAQIDGYYRSILPHRETSIDVIGALRFMIFGEGRRGVVVGDDGWLFSSEEFNAAGDQSANVAKAVEGIAAIKAALNAEGVALVVAPLPAKTDLYREHVSGPAIPEELESLYETFLGELAAAGVTTVDTRAALAAAKNDGPLFLTTDTHWTPLGARRVAESIAESDASLIGEGSYRLDAAPTVQRQGDLTKFVVEGDLAVALGLGPEAVVPWHATATDDDAADVGDIFGSSAIPIALVGTSYSANTQWGFSDALMSALGSDILNVALEGLGPVEPMRRFLSSDTMRDSPPATVIWEFPIRYIGAPDLWNAAEPTPEGAR